MLIVTIQLDANAKDLFPGLSARFLPLGGAGLATRGVYWVSRHASFRVLRWRHSNLRGLQAWFNRRWLWFCAETL